MAVRTWGNLTQNTHTHAQMYTCMYTVHTCTYSLRIAPGPPFQCPREH